MDDDSDSSGGAVRVVQMTMEEELVERVDAAARALGVSRSAFARQALQEALDALDRRRREQAHRSGYERLPVRPGEFDWGDEDEEWGDPWEET